MAAAQKLDRGMISRADVAAVLVSCLHDDRTVGLSFDLVGGDDQIADALAALR